MGWCALKWFGQRVPPRVCDPMPTAYEPAELRSPVAANSPAARTFEPGETCPPAPRCLASPCLGGSAHGVERASTHLAQPLRMFQPRWSRTCSGARNRGTSTAAATGPPRLRRRSELHDRHAHDEHKGPAGEGTAHRLRRDQRLGECEPGAGHVPCHGDGGLRGRRRRSHIRDAQKPQPVVHMLTPPRHASRPGAPWGRS